MLDRVARSWFPAVIAALGAAVLVLGFAYDIIYAGIPYQPDAPIELQIQYDRNRAFAGRIYKGGGCLLAAGLALTLLQVPVRIVANRRGRRRPPDLQP